MLSSKLTMMERRFCQELVAMDTWKPGEAILLAGSQSKNPAVVAAQTMRKPRVKKYLEQLQHKREQRTEISADEVWRYLWYVLQFDPATVYKSDGNGWWIVEDLQSMPLETRQIITAIEAGSVLVGSAKDAVHVPVVKVQFVNKDRMAQLAMRHLVPIPTQKHEVVEKKVVEFIPMAESVDEYDDPISCRIEEEKSRLVNNESHKA